MQRGAWFTRVRFWRNGASLGIKHCIPMPWPAALAIAWVLANRNRARVGWLLLQRCVGGLRPGGASGLLCDIFVFSGCGARWHRAPRIVSQAWDQFWHNANFRHIQFRGTVWDYWQLVAGHLRGYHAVWNSFGRVVSFTVCGRQQTGGCWRRRFGACSLDTSLTQGWMSNYALPSRHELH